MKKPNTFEHALRANRSIFGSVIVFSAAVNLLMFVGPLYMLQIYDRVLQSRSEATLVALTAIAIGMLLIYAFLEWIRSRVLVRAGLRFDDMIASSLFNKVVRTTITNPQGQTQFALSDIDKLREFLTGQGLISLCDLPWVPIFLVVCFVFHPMIGWVATAGALIVFVLAFLNEFVTKRALSEAAAHGQSAQYFANTTLQNVEAIRALGMEGNLRGRWSQMHNDMLASQAVASDKAGALLSASRFVRMSLQIVILGVGAYLALEGAITPGVMIAASIMMGRALAPVDQIASQWKQFVAARAAYGRLKSLFATVEEEDEKTDLPEPKGAVSAEGLTVAAPGSSTPIVKGVTFAVEPGDVMAIVGPSGAGKSSLIRALVGVWPPTGGAARLDGSELQHWDNDKLGRHFGYLPQTVELFAGTIAENIARFDEVDDARVVAAAEAANAHTLIQSLPDGYDTQIGPGGGKLSGGQRQRVGFARALYADPKVLILDEPNANLDSDGEEALARAITGLREQGRTVLFVSHKMSLIALSNKALLLKDGRMQAFGDTKDLLQPKMLKAVGDKAKLAATKAAAGAA